MAEKIDRSGEKWKTNEGYIVEIINYINKRNTIIKFSTGNIKKVEYGQLKKGTVRNPLHKSVFEIGFLGEGEYKARVANKPPFIWYNAWKNMLSRCYDKKFQEKQPTYIDCIVTPEWHNFQNFAEWFEDNYIEGWHLDKDILVKGNKIYSPETCCFVPQEVNCLFTLSEKTRTELPIGVRRNKSKKRFESFVSLNSIEKYLGVFNTAEEAFQAYKTAKELYIKEIAEKWKDKITENVYKALINYKIQIID